MRVILPLRPAEGAEGIDGTNATTKKRLILFIAFAVIIAWILFLSIPLGGFTYGDRSTLAILAAAMFAPAISSILTRLITKEGFGNMYLHPNFRGHARAYLLIYFGPSILLLLSGVFYYIVFPGAFNPEFAGMHGLSPLDGTAGGSAVSLLLVPLLIFIAIGPVANIIPTLGEELGWRGYLLPKLREFFSDRAALVITGAVWGIWHLPIIVMGHNYGIGYIGYPWLGILAMVVFCIVLGIIEGYATIKLGSVIPAAMIHSTVNAGVAFPIIVAREFYDPLLGPAITGLVGGLPFLVVAIILFFKSQKNVPS